jgi:hypothetical protein
MMSAQLLQPAGGERASPRPDCPAARSTKPLSSVSIRIGFADLLDPSRRRVHAMLQHRFGRTPIAQFAEAVQVLCNRSK